MRKTVAHAVCLAVLTFTGPSLGASKVQGRILSEGVTGRPAAPVSGWEQEFLYVGQIDVGFSAGAKALHKNPGPAGWFSIDGAIGGGWVGGSYSLFALNNMATSIIDNYGSPAFSYRIVDLPAGSAVVDPLNLTTPAHYCVRFDEDVAPWVA
jgi:hypothetical protein